MVRFLVDRGHINARNEDGDTCLHLAVKWGDRSVISLLVERGADMDALNNNGESPLSLADRGIARLLTKKRRLASKKGRLQAPGQ